MEIKGRQAHPAVLRSVTAGTSSSRVQRNTPGEKHFLGIGHHDKWSQVLHSQDSMPEHCIFFPSFTSELILTHPRKMLIPWKCSHSQSSSRNRSNKGLQWLAWPPKWKQLIWQNRGFILKQLFLGWLTCSCPTMSPAALSPKAKGLKPLDCTASQLLYTAKKECHKLTPDISLH